MNGLRLVPGRLVPLDVPQLAAGIAAGASVTFDYRWSLTGRVVLLRLDVREATVDPSNVLLSIATDENEQLFADVYGARAVSARLIGGTRPPRSATYSRDKRRGGLPLARPVREGETWRITISNAATAGGPTTFPLVTFLTVDA